MSWRVGGSQSVSEKEKDGSVKRILPKGESERNSFQKETSHFIIERKEQTREDMKYE